AVRLTVSPQAMPMRRRPKSNARTIRGAPLAGLSGIADPGDAGSGIAADRADTRQLHSQEATRGVPARFERQVENQTGVDRGVEPCVRPDLILELSAVPAGIPQGDDGFRRTLAAGHRGQNIARR